MADGWELGNAASASEEAQTELKIKIDEGSHLLPWLLAVLLFVGLIGSVATALDDRQQGRAALGRARDEAADFRRTLFVAQDRLHGAERELGKTKAALVTTGSEKQASSKLIDDLRAKLDAKEGEISQQANQITVNLVDEILFKSGDADISPRGKEVLSRVGGVLKELTDKQILIGGHTDDRPIRTERFPSNWELSAGRAVNVARYLAETVGVSPKRLAAAAFSEFHPRAKSRAKNRRIEILLTPVVTVKSE